MNGRSALLSHSIHNLLLRGVPPHLPLSSKMKPSSQWILLISLLTVARTQESMFLSSSCCSLATGSCRTTCEEISLVELATRVDDRWQHFSKLTSFCSEQLVPFWSCMNETLSEIDTGQGFFGRPCCTIPQSQACIMVCLQAKDREELISACRPSDEITFYSCLERQEVGQQCCSRAGKAECAGACKELFASTTEPSVTLRSYVNNMCANDHPSVTKCVKNYTLLTHAENPARNIHCCDRSSNADCRLACRNILRTQKIGQEIVDNLIDGGCGYPMPHDKLWQCFLTNSDSGSESEPKSVSQLDNLGMDSSKLQCCFRAATITCQRLCIKTYSHEWEETWGEFDQQCQYQLAESAMIKCLAEVEEPCELGCDNLSYCSHFNRRPTEMFRSCSARTDQAARHDVRLWRQGVIRMPTVDVPVLDIAHCHPDAWKAVACALQIKPCASDAANMICRSDCIKILSNCVDRSRLLDGQTPSSLCDLLSPPGINAPCISLAPYLEESKYIHTTLDVTHPCKASTCATNEVCLVNRSCNFGETCAPFICVPGCRMGAFSQVVVPGGTYTMIPRLYKGKHCNSVCYCNKQGIIDNCVAMPCLNKGHCTVLGREIPHQGQYVGNCSVCFCFSGELRCATTCAKNSFSDMELIAAGPLCTCSRNYNPVCGVNGKTYTNPCVARCAGLKDSQLKPGMCSEIDPCKENTCGSKKRCVPRRQVCLSLKKKCSQFICVPKDNCEDKPYSPVCDTENDEHPNACSLLEKKRTLAYFGKCLSKCQRKGSVCGHDGEEYKSECSAWAVRMSIDYRGPCVPQRPTEDKRLGCAGVTCQPLPSEHCNPIIPPNSCCPICGTALKLVYSQRLLDHTVDAIHTTEPVTVSKLARKLQEHIKTAECEVTAHLSDDSTLVAMVLPTTGQPSAMQIEACAQEAIKLNSLVTQRSPSFVTELPLAALVGSYLVHPIEGVLSGGAILALNLWVVLGMMVILNRVGNVT